MTFVGKVLIVVQVVLSFCFLAFAGAVYSVQTNWKEKTENAENQLAQARSDLATAEEQHKQEVATLTTERDNQQQRADGFEAQAGGLQEQVQRVQNELETVRTELSNQQALAQISDEEAKMRRDEALRQRAENRSLHESRDQLVTRVRQLEDRLFGEEVEKKSMVRRHNNLLEEVSFLRRVVRNNDLDTDPKAYAGVESPPPDVQGLVMNTRSGRRTGTDFVEISLGSDDGLANGHEVFVYRQDGGGRYIGKVQIVHVTPDRAVGTVIERAKNGVIQRGDHVTTKL